MSTPFRALFFCTFLCMLVMPSEGGKIQNFSVSFDSLSVKGLLPDYDLLPYASYAVVFSYAAYMNDTGDKLIFMPYSSSTFYILSIVSDDCVVWMANRNNPVSGNFSLTLNQSSGNLELLDGDGSLAWSSNITSRPESGVVSMELSTAFPMHVATLRLSDVNNATLWQSSDHPTHALVTNQYLRPGKSLISWASPYDPSEGLYTLVMEAGGLALYYNASADPQPYWTWSLYEGVDDDLFDVAHTCSNLTTLFMNPEGALFLLASNEIATPDLTSPDLCDTVAFKRELAFDDYGKSDVLALSLQYDGNLVAYRLQSAGEISFDLFSDNLCLLPNYCGSYGVCTGTSNCECPQNSDGSFPLTVTSNLSQGCPPTHKLTCQSQQYFLPLSGVDYYSNNFSSPLDFSTQETCKNACLQNCSCLAAFWRVHTRSCFHVHHMSSLRGSFNSSYLAFLKVENVSQPPSSAPRLVGGVVSGLVGGVVSGVLGLLILCMSAAFIYTKLRTDPEPEEEDPFWNSVPRLPTRYSYRDLHSITNGFNETLGKGGFGTVYAGVLQDGARVAVKRLESLRQGKKEFRAEIVILGGIHHYNLVGLIGFCAEGSHRLLVYEYMAKGSLDQWIFTAATPPLNWENRFKIARGAARGLAYLHRDCKDKIIHLDIKPQNILVDEDFVAKVSDFGMSTLMGRDETHVMTTMRGTPGYLAPEWLTEGSISEKCDVFSFGKLLLEILGGRRNLDPSVADTDKLYFPSWLYHQVAQGGETNLPKIGRVETAEETRQARLLMNTPFLCVLENPDQRPSMERVVTMLEGLTPALEHLLLSSLFQGLRWALSMPAPTLTQSTIDKALAPIYQSASSSSSFSYSSS